MKTKLGANGQIAIPVEVRQEDHLLPGDSFEWERVSAGQYLLARENRPDPSFVVMTEEDGLPTIRGARGRITLELVKEIESRVP